nr:helix-turn-helix domain-containing protein [Actinomadura rayongensis]
MGDVDDPGGTAARAIVRRLQSALGAHRPDALSALTGEGGVILFPAASGTLDAVTAELPGLVARIGASLARPVTGAVARADNVAAVPAAHREATEIADLARRLGLPPGCHALEDVLLEYQLARPGRGLAGLAAKLRPLDDHPVLLETVRALVRHGNNRTRTAAHLHVHRNTLDYRLGRVAALTGLDAGDPRDLRVLHAAVTAHTLAEP